MPRKPSFPPRPRRPHSSGQARIVIQGRTFYLGKFGSPAMYAEYDRLLGEWRAGRLDLARARAAGQAITVNDVVARFFQEAERGLYLDADGSPKSEIANFKFSLEPLAVLYGHVAAAELTARQLKTVRNAMASGQWGKRRENAGDEDGPRGWCRNVCNRSLSRIKLLIRWAESEDLVPPGKAAHLDTVPGFELGQYGVRETDDIAPAPESAIAATLLHCNHVVRALVELLLLTGARPKELRMLTPGDIARDGRVEIAKGFWVTLGGIWAIPLRRHKTAHKKIRRVLLLGPKGQEVLRPFLDRPPDQFLFQPAEAMAGRAADRRARRKSPVPPSQVSRAKGGRQLRDHYSQKAFARSIDYAIAAANREAVAAELDRAQGPLPAELLQPWHFVPHWHPYQLRHNAATRIIAEFDWDVARIVLGHTKEEMTKRYGSDDLRQAAEAQARAG